MLIYAGCTPEADGIPVENSYYMIIAYLSPGIGNEIYFFFVDYETFCYSSFHLESGSWSGFEVVPHSRISFYPSEVV